MSVITKDLGVATAYGYAKSKGYTGTEEEFAELMASYADVAQQAEASAQDAEDAKDAAITAKTAAQTAQTAAESAQTAAAGSAQTASTKATEASNSATAAAGSATAAGNSATDAAESASTAQTAAQTATTKASEASSSASAASTAKTGAETARTGAQTAQTAAETAQANAEAAASSVSASAAQIEQNTADIGAIKNDLSEQTASEPIVITYKNKYIKTNGSTVNINAPYGFDGWNSAVVDCSADDMFYINGVGGDSPRLWAFTDASYNVVAVADNGAVGNGLVLTAPTNASKLIINDNSGATSYKGIPASVRLDTLEADKVDKSGTGQVTKKNTTFFVPVEFPNLLDAPDGSSTNTPLVLNVNDNVFTVTKTADLTSTKSVAVSGLSVELPAGTYSISCYALDNYGQQPYGAPFHFDVYNGSTQLVYAWIADDAGRPKQFTIANDTTVTFSVMAQYTTECNALLNNFGNMQFTVMLNAGSDAKAWRNPKDNYVFDGAELSDYATVGMFENIGVIGDSYASGQIFLSGSPVNYYNLSWGQVMARRNGAECINFSRGGLTTKTWLSDDKGLSLMQSSPAQELYIIALGINDYTEINASRYTLGTSADFDLSDYTDTPDTFYGNMCKIIGYIKVKSPNAKIILSTMAKNDNAVSRNINNAITGCAELAGVGLIVQQDDDFFKSDYYLDGMVSAHPTAPVYSGMALAFERLINKCMKDNYTYFSTFVWSE